MTELRPTPVMVTLVQAPTSLPVFLFALPAGAIGDAVDHLFIVLQVVSVILALLLGLARCEAPPHWCGGHENDARERSSPPLTESAQPALASSG